MDKIRLQTFGVVYVPTLHELRNDVPLKYTFVAYSTVGVFQLASCHSPLWKATFQSTTVQKWTSSFSMDLIRHVLGYQISIKSEPADSLRP